MPLTPPAPRVGTAGGPSRSLIDLFPPNLTIPPDAPAGPPLDAPAAPPRARVTAPAIGLGSTGATCETFYGLQEPPFSLSTDPKFFYHSTVHDQVAQTLLGAIGRREGVVVMTGEGGLGKTTLCRAVVDQLDRRTLTSLVAEPLASTELLLKTILADFGVISRDDLARSAPRADLVGALHNFLVSLAALEAFAVVILDEAHDLPVDVLEQVRALADGLGDEPLLQIILVGEPSLDRKLQRTELRPLHQRVTTRCRLKPIAADEVGGYIAHRVAVAGASPRVEFDDAAASRIYTLSGGVPRVINLLCDQTLEAGFEASASLLDDRLVEAAAGELDLAALSPRSGWREKLATAVVMLLLVALGAAAGAYVFRADLAAVVGKWRSPQTSRSPQPAPAPPGGAATPPR